MTYTQLLAKLNNNKDEAKPFALPVYTPQEECDEERKREIAAEERSYMRGRNQD